MQWYQWLAVAALAVCITSCLYHFIRIIQLGAPPEYARRAGNVGPAVRYSFTGAMSPFQKESAYLHWPTYTAGIIYHIGTFLAIALFFLALLNIGIYTWLIWPVIIVLAISACCGIGVLIKRITKHELSSLSNPDDYISNTLVTLFQAVTAITLFAAMHQVDLRALYFVISAMLLFYFPLGKLKHAVYFFAARYHLGFFYGWRGVWPPKPIKK